MPGQSEKPSVGLVVPSYNCARYLKDCIDSILAQDYPVQCLVVDGASKDETVAILSSYGTQISWVSEPDKGQADAIQKGFQRLDCDLIGWLNADDRLLPKAISTLVSAALVHPEAVLFHGHVERVDAQGRLIGQSLSIPMNAKMLRCGKGRVVQPGSLYRRSALIACGGVDKSFHLLMDVDLWIRLAQQGTTQYIDQNLAQFRVHPEAKSSQPPAAYYAESLRLAHQYQRDHLPAALFQRGLQLARHELLWRLHLNRLTVRPSSSLQQKTVGFSQTVQSPHREAILQALADAQPSGGLPPQELFVCQLPAAAQDWIRLLGQWDRARILVIEDEKELERAPSALLHACLKNCAFVLGSTQVIGALRERGYPHYRLGDLNRLKQWSRAARVAAGDLGALYDFPIDSSPSKDPADYRERPHLTVD